MDKDTAEYIKEIGNSIAEHWQFYLVIIGGVLGSMWWAIQKVFPTHKVMRDCERDMKESLERHEREEIRRNEEYHRSNAEQHQTINTRLDRIISHLLENSK